MSIQTSNNENTLIEWEIAEFESHQRGAWWYFGAMMLGGGLLVIALVSGNFLFALMMILVAVLLVFYERQGPRRVQFRVSDFGVWLGDQMRPFEDVDHFFMVTRNDGVQMVYFSFKSVYRQRWSVPLGDGDPAAVRKVLRRFVREEVEEAHEPLSDVLSRWLKL